MESGQIMTNILNKAATQIYIKDAVDRERDQSFLKQYLCNENWFSHTALMGRHCYDHAITIFCSPLVTAAELSQSIKLATGISLMMNCT